MRGRSPSRWLRGRRVSVAGSNYVIGGWPNTWRTQTNWNDHFQRYDGALIWQSQNHLADRQQLSAWGIAYFPHVAPGGSWSHLQKYSSDSERDYGPRTGGALYWQAVNDALRMHKRLGNPIAVWRDGKVVILPPEEINVPPDDSERKS